LRIESTSKTLGQIIRLARKEKGITQKDLAGKLGHATPMFVSLFERGESKVPLETLGSLIVILDLSEKLIVRLLVMDFQSKLENELLAGFKRWKAHEN
jgi:transcriptional regulator with XRE-family HTH domain